MNIITTLTVLLLALLLSACASSRNQDSTTPTVDSMPIDSLYDSRLLDTNTRQALSRAELADKLRDVDVVFIGEIHGHNGAHLLQSRLQVALHRQRPRQILSMEQFTVDHQKIIDRYLGNTIGEAALIDEADAWANYRASYRPLVEFARYNRLPVIAANAPANIVRCVGQQGPGYLDQLDGGDRQWLPDEPFYGTAAYKEKFLAAMGTGVHGDEAQEASERRYRAQLLRDNTMATAIHRAHQSNPRHQIIHLSGRFHIENRLGTVAALAHRAPDLSMRIITPVLTENPGRPEPQGDHYDRGDVLYFLRSLPPEYRQPEKRKQAMTEHFAQQSQARCGAQERD
jgi:uncharacterized iron-regulated protein